MSNPKPPVVQPTKNIIPVGPGYVCIPSEAIARSREGAAPRLAVVAIAERSEGLYQACVLDMEGRLQFSTGPIYPEGPSHDRTSSSKALQEIAQSLKALVSIEQQRKQTPPAT